MMCFYKLYYMTSTVYDSWRSKDYSLVMKRFLCTFSVTNIIGYREKEELKTVVVTNWWHMFVKFKSFDHYREDKTKNSVIYFIII